ncbi:3-hydroxyisobutyrate dehydrogenase-like beta-hydroxyacid dehydrogenase [Mycobacterium frederiksbergense]|uniref:3-hydroxyisobutyrate dehydrogenase-like beta-hydroxyacid dehydrogenase n=1 Tax=Mycolicibacterium frederiksbergense TaxID=117567 RepID=A0ABT6L0S6_9MYCO|nr:NAD(P)-binding domain-containing protein [Mycolicibacterium frederiksbergense]MDH6196553.1 3-hydroxyisobutyrate dehydrogenase-like beta-hydroxyacid dehydrogenase [Mycolicibacterium frederiksbergense]
MTNAHCSVSFLGLGAMGSQLARTALNAGHPTIVWNRSAARTAALTAEGATAAPTVGQALDADLIVACLFDQASVREVLDPVADRLAGRRLVNLTTTSPDGARELARWVAEQGSDYLDGGIMATPEMIGTTQSAILYSGSAALFDDHRDVFELWGSAEYFGEDAGMASLYDLALLSAMYVMFAGFFHGAAMVGAAGVPAKEFAARTAAWLPALMPALADYATVIDGGDYGVPGQQSLYFSDVSDIVNASRDQGISTEVIDVVQRLIHRQIDAGHGTDGFARVIESIKTGAAA